MVGLDSAGLTNKPAIPAMERLAASQRVLDLDKEVETFAEGNAMEMLRQLKSELGLEGEHTVEQVLAAVLAKIKGLRAAETVAASVRTRLGLTADSSEAAVLVALDGRLEASAVRVTSLEAEEIVREALHQNKIAAGDKDRLAWLKSLALKSPVVAREVLSQLRAVAPPGRVIWPDAELDDRNSRTNTIRSAAEAFRADERNAKVTSMRSWVNTALRDQALPLLSDSEVKAFSLSEV